MTYEEWLSILDDLKKPTLSTEKIELLKNTSINNNINDLIVPKIENTIDIRFSNAINKIINNLDEIFYDKNMLDMELVNFKKEIKYIQELINLKQLPTNVQNELRIKIKDQTAQVFDILKKEANKIDYTGTFSLIIDNNKIKWSD